MVRVEGIEPTRFYNHLILSQARLPVSPHSQLKDRRNTTVKVAVIRSVGLTVLPRAQRAAPWQPACSVWLSALALAATG